jgi:hypothetical protein
VLGLHLEWDTCPGALVIFLQAVILSILNNVIKLTHSGFVEITNQPSTEVGFVLTICSESPIANLKEICPNV